MVSSHAAELNTVRVSRAAFKRVSVPFEVRGLTVQVLRTRYVHVQLLYNTVVECIRQWKDVKKFDACQIPTSRLEAFQTLATPINDCINSSLLSELARMASFHKQYYLCIVYLVSTNGAVCK